MTGFSAAARFTSVVAMIGLAAAACQGSGDKTAAGGESAAAGQSDSMGGMAGMSGMSGMSGTMNTAAMDSMHARMQMMDTMGAERMKQMLPMHRQMAANMLSQMNSEMRSMNMAADAAWTATVDSLRGDLVRMPDMSSAELKAMMPAHHARMRRLMQTHRDMMGKMKS